MNEKVRYGKGIIAPNEQRPALVPAAAFFLFKSALTWPISVLSLAVAGVAAILAYALQREERAGGIGPARQQMMHAGESCFDVVRGQALRRSFGG